jgi:hypothetical protein
MILNGRGSHNLLFMQGENALSVNSIESEIHPNIKFNVFILSSSAPEAG